MAERWASVPNWEDLYEASDLGRIRSLDRVVFNALCRTRTVHGRVLKPTIKKRRKNRRVVLLSDCGRRRYATVARLVLEAFIGPCPEGMECCHANDDPGDNRLANLRWDTHANNIRDSLTNGGRCMGERHRCAKMTGGKVRVARAMHTSGQFAVNALSKIFSISNPAMKNILERRAWKHV